jgi:FKBP-type peptidyl-prolyl cis-trans isomerase FklB
MLAGAAFFILHSSFFISCSKDDDDTTVQTLLNWQSANDQYFLSLEKKYAACTDGSWLKFKSYTLGADSVKGGAFDYVYVEVLEKTSDPLAASPLYTDSVRVSYQGRLIPTTANSKGTVFGGTVYGEYNPKTNGTSKFAVATVVYGFGTALMHLQIGDTWRVYVPSYLGYGTSSVGSIPANSTLIFDVTLVDIAKPGNSMRPYSAPRKME